MPETLTLRQAVRVLIHGRTFAMWEEAIYREMLWSQPNPAIAASLLGVSRQTIYNKIRKYKIDLTTRIPR